MQYCQSQLGAKLLNGNKQSQEDDEQEDHGDGDNVIDKEKFTRVFEIAALRVPAKDCFALESRLRGHLLNWPRIRNIARVPGDEVEEELAPLLGATQNGNTDEEGNFDALNRRIYGRAEGDGEELSPVLYRERLAKEFNARGFVRFRNLAKVSRPPRKKRKQGEGEEKKRERNERKGRDEFSMVEVVEEDVGEDWKGLLGDEFKGRSKWRGSTRLLLLDESYADKGVEDLPQAIKVANPNTFGTLRVCFILFLFLAFVAFVLLLFVTLYYIVSCHDSAMSVTFLIQMAVQEVHCSLLCLNVALLVDFRVF